MTINGNCEHSHSFIRLRHNDTIFWIEYRENTERTEGGEGGGANLDGQKQNISIIIFMCILSMCVRI